MHKVPGIGSVAVTFYKICSFCDSTLPSRSTALKFSFVLVL